jgi:hypothetical protein
MHRPHRTDAHRTSKTFFRGGQAKIPCVRTVQGGEAPTRRTPGPPHGELAVCLRWRRSPFLVCHLAGDGLVATPGPPSAPCRWPWLAGTGLDDEALPALATGQSHTWDPRHHPCLHHPHARTRASPTPAPASTSTSRVTRPCDVTG